MTQKSGLFNSVSGDRSYSDIDVATYISLLSQGHGVIADYLNDLEVNEGTGLQVLVNTGGAWLGDPAGWWYINDSQEALTLDAETSGVSRIDRIVIRLDRNTDTRSCILCVLKGIAHTSPAVPSLTQNEMVFEISLAQVLITGGLMISVTDERGSTAGHYIYRNNSVLHNFTLDSGVSAGDCVLYDADNSEWIASEKGIGIYDGNKIILFGNIVITSGLTAGYNYYSQSDGSISKILSSYKVGYAISSTEIVVIGDGTYGIDEAYTKNMTAFYPMPSKATEVRLKIEMPDDADGVMIRGDVVPYDGSGIDWGYYTVNVIDDSNYHRYNEWYSNGGLTTGTKYYYKAFPYISGTYNDAQGSNEIEVTCRSGLAEWTADDISGSTALDQFNSYNLTANNMTYTSFEIGNGFTFSSSYLYRAKFLPSSVISFSARIKFSTTGIKYLFGENQDVGYSDYGWGIGIDASGHVFLNTNRVNQSAVSTSLAINTEYSLGITYNRGTGQMKVYVNGSYIGTVTVSVPDMTNVVNFYMGASWLVGGDAIATSSPMQLDQVRIYSGELVADDFGLLHRGGSAR